MLPSALCRLLPAVLLVHGVLSPGGEVQGQAVLSVGARGGASFPVGGFRTDLESGPSLGVDLQHHAGIGTLFVGFSQHRFSCVGGGCRSEEKYVTTGWDLGLRRVLFAGEVLRPYLQAGAVISRTERLDGPSGGDSGSSPELSRLTLGGEAGGGLEVRVASRLRVEPGLRYGLGNARFSEGPLRMRYLVADLGVRVTF